MLITRQIINQDIKYHDYNRDTFLGTYDYRHFSRLVDAYKNLFIKYGAKKGSTVVIGNQADTMQIALVFACAELGLSIVIIGNPFPPGKSAKEYIPGMINLKLKLMLPIDFFIVNNPDTTDKFSLFKDISRFTITLDDKELDYTPNDTIWADEQSVLLKCTSSGTTGTPKIILHTHGFMSKLVERNSKQFYGNMGMLSNLAHGSSPAVYFLPGLMSNNVTGYYNLPYKSLQDISTMTDKLDHLLVPYTIFLDDFFATDAKLDGCMLHTLGGIRKSWVEEIKKGRAKDIISIFGTNETSGPFLINQATDDDFTEDTYKLMDDFYGVNITSNNELEVTVPVYDNVLKTHDTFLKRGAKFVHIGRSNLYRINDLEIDLGRYQIEIDKIMKGVLVVDTKKESIYLAIWDTHIDQEKVKHIDTLMRNDSNGFHFIKKHAALNYPDYLNGIKIDNEMLREYFRNQ